jgi:hypothetical protein
MTRLSITTLAALGMLLGTVPVARAADATCANQTISNATISGNLVVTGACTVGNGVTVGGIVTVESGGSLTISPTSSPVKIGGNILTDTGCVFVDIVPFSSGSVTIGGNVEIGCTGKVSSTELRSSFYQGPNVKISGNFTCTGNALACFGESGSVGGNVEVNDNAGGGALEGNKIGGNVEVDGNGGSSVMGNTIGGNVEVDGNGGSSVTGNTIGGNLTCTGNASPFTGGPNTVHGKYLPSPGSQCHP